MNGSLHYDSYLHILDEEMIPTQGGGTEFIGVA